MPTFIADNGEDFLVQQLDRSYKGTLTEVLKVDGKTGTVTVAGQTISSSGVIGSTGAVTATTVTASGAVAAQSTLAVTGNTTVGGTLGVTGNTTVGGTFGVTGNTTLTGTLTVGGKTPMTGSLYSAIIAGADASGGVVSTVLAGAVIGDKVVACVNLTGATDVQTSFETAVTVTGHIQQTTTDLAAATKILVILQHL